MPDERQPQAGFSPGALVSLRRLRQVPSRRTMRGGPSHIRQQILSRLESIADAGGITMTFVSSSLYGRSRSRGGLALAILFALGLTVAVQPATAGNGAAIVLAEKDGKGGGNWGKG